MGYLTSFIFDRSTRNEDSPIRRGVDRPDGHRLRNVSIGTRRLTPRNGHQWKWWRWWWWNFCSSHADQADWSRSAGHVVLRDADQWRDRHDFPRPPGRRNRRMVRRPQHIEEVRQVRSRQGGGLHP